MVAMVTGVDRGKFK